MTSSTAREAKTVFDSIIDRCGTLPASVTLDYGVGSPVQTIVSAGDKLSADMVVMGTHGKGPLDSLLFGSVSNDVVAHSSSSHSAHPRTHADFRVPEAHRDLP